jgi:hypothetical protein
VSPIPWEADLETAGRASREMKRPLLVDFWDPG